MRILSEGFSSRMYSKEKLFSVYHFNVFSNPGTCNIYLMQHTFHYDILRIYFAIFGEENIVSLGIYSRAVKNNRNKIVAAIRVFGKEMKKSKGLRRNSLPA